MIDLTLQTVDENGKPAVYQAQVPKQKKDPNTGKMTEVMGLEETPVTVFRLLKTALLTNSIRMKRKWQEKRYNLFMKIRAEDEVTFTRAEKKLIKKLVAETFDVIVYGQILDILNQD